MRTSKVIGILVSTLIATRVETSDPAKIFRSTRSGAWSAPVTWEGVRFPTEGSSSPDPGGSHGDLRSGFQPAIRFIHVAGILTFAPDRNTRLDVGLLRIEAGENASEDGFDCDAHAQDVGPGHAPGRLSWLARQKAHRRGMQRHYPARLVRGPGSPELPGHRLLRRPHGDARRPDESYLGQSRGRRPRAAIASCRSAEAVAGWRVGDHVILTATQTHDNGRQQGTLRPGVTGGEPSRKKGPSLRSATEG